MSIQSLPSEIAFLIILSQEDPTSLRMVNKRFSLLTLMWFSKVNQILVNSDRIFEQVFHDAPQSVISSPLKLFMRLVNHLHDETETYRTMKRLDRLPDETEKYNSDIKAPSGRDRLQWECQNIYNLMNNLQYNLQKGRKNDFVLFCNQLFSKHPDFLHEMQQQEHETTYDFYKRVLHAKESSVESLTTFRSPLKSLRSIPKEIGLFKNLETLNFCGCPLRYLPTEITSLSKLKVLRLMECRLNSFPKEILQLSTLKVLSIAGNQITQLPSELGGLTSLENLNISCNQITTVPPELGQLNLLEFDTTGNEITSLPPTLVNANKVAKEEREAVIRSNRAG